MRAEYVVLLTGTLQARLAVLERDVQLVNCTSTPGRASKQREQLQKKHLELLGF